MRSQAIGVPQFTESFETPLAPIVKTGAIENNFATALHHAAGETIPVAPGQKTPLPGKMMPAIAGKAGGEEPAAFESSALAADVPAALAGRPSTSGPATLTQPTSTAASIDADAPLADAEMVPVHHEVSGANSTKQEVAVRKDSAAKADALTAKNRDAKPTIENRVTAAVNNVGAVTPLPLDRPTNDATLQGVALQNQPVVVADKRYVLSASPAVVSANKAATPVAQASAARGDGMSANKKDDAETDASSPAQGVAASDGSSLVKDVSTIPSLPVATDAGSPMHGALVADTTSGGVLTLGGHSIEGKNASIAPTTHELMGEGVGSTDATQLHVATASGSMLPHTTLSATATSLEVGVANGTHGWLKIRAEMTGGGAVNASLTGGSSMIADRLRGDLPELSSYLQSEKIQVNGLDVHAAVLSGGAAAGLMNSDRPTYDGSGGLGGSADGGAMGGRSQQQHGQEAQGVSAPIGNEEKTEALMARVPDSELFGDGVRLDGNSGLSAGEYGTSGSWLNVRA